MLTSSKGKPGFLYSPHGSGAVSRFSCVELNAEIHCFYSCSHDYSGWVRCFNQVRCARQNKPMQSLLSQPIYIEPRKCYCSTIGSVVFTAVLTPETYVETEVCCNTTCYDSCILCSISTVRLLICALECHCGATALFPIRLQYF